MNSNIEMENNLRTRSNTYALVYALVLPKIQDIANALGYALCVHGSMQRDLDIVLVPWVYGAESPEKVVTALQRSLRGLKRNHFLGQPEVKPHGRLSWSFYLSELGASKAKGPYIDISVMPLLNKEGEI